MASSESRSPPALRRKEEAGGVVRAGFVSGVIRERFRLDNCPCFSLAAASSSPLSAEVSLLLQYTRRRKGEGARGGNRRPSSGGSDKGFLISLLSPPPGGIGTQ